MSINDIKTNMENQVNMLGDPNNRNDISISNFPIDLDNKFANILLLENYLMKFEMSDLTFNLVTDQFQNRENIITSETNEYNFGSDTTLSLTFRLDEYKRNYYMFFAWGTSLVRKDYYDSSGEFVKESITANDFKIDYITIDQFDNFGELRLLNSFTCYGLYLTSLSKPEPDMNSKNYIFTATFKYEFFRLNTERMATLEELGFMFEINKLNITGDETNVQQDKL